MPSPLKLPTPTTVYAVEDEPKPCQVGRLLLIAQKPVSPPELLRHSTSAMWSPLKSPTPTTVYAVEDEPRPCQVGRLLLIAQKPVSPLELLSHSTSEML